MTTWFKLVPLLITLLTQFVSLEAVRFYSNASSLNVHVRCIDKERKALLKFRDGLEDHSSKLSSWAGQDCCRWKGVGCSDGMGSVVKLDLSNSACYKERYYGERYSTSPCLVGKISPLIDLKHLNYLDLSMNNFQGMPIPKFLGSFEKLRYLNLSYANFSGMVPLQLANLSNLQVLDLNVVSYSYYVGGSWVSNLNWVLSLSSLKHLNLGSVNLSLATTHWVQVFNMLPSLTELHLANTDLGNIPQSLPYLNFTSLSVLDLSYNDFNSSVTQWLFNISSLEKLYLLECSFKSLPRSFSYLSFTSLLVLDLSYNDFNSSVPQWLFNISSLAELSLRDCVFKGLFSQFTKGDFCKLRHLDLSRNEISGGISELVRSLSECNNNSLEELDLSSNQLSGQLPHSLGHLKYLRTLHLYYNSISGSIPESIGRLSNLEVFMVDANKMNGSIPKSFENLTKLKTVSLGENYWEGVLSETHFQGLTKLKYFGISSSNKALVFNVSHDWVPPFRLIVIGIESCRLGSKFPAWLQNQTQLEYITLIDVGISDTIPHWFWKMFPQINRLNLSKNQIRGILLNTSSKFRWDTYMDLSFNCLEGPLPLWPNVSYLNLKNNSFSGPIPMNIGQVMSTLAVLRLSGNTLNGSIPPSISEMTYLSELDLSNNHLSGKIHNQWSDLQLLAIDLSSNHLSGHIPSSICSLRWLLVLKLSKNNLLGKVPFSLKNCIALTLLDLGENRFSGNIPKWIGESLLSLKELRLRANQLSGKIPKQLCRLPELHVLDFALNNLTGFVPTCLGNLSGLSSLPPPYIREEFIIEMELVMKGSILMYSLTLALVKIIDLSGNNLSGEIPREITNLSTLGTLNLSSNHLTGKIPDKIGDLRMLETLDLSCNHLSGPIPPTMVSMTLLSHLNVSHNNLSGPIPSSNQFLTFNDASSFEGNPGLCGSPLPICITANVKENEDQNHAKDESEDKYETLGFYVSMALGFVVGFWVVCGTLVIKESWRHAYFGFVEKMKDWLFVVIVVNCLQRMRERNRN